MKKVVFISALLICLMCTFNTKVKADDWVQGFGYNSNQVSFWINPIDKSNTNDFRSI